MSTTEDTALAAWLQGHKSSSSARHRCAHRFQEALGLAKKPDVVSVPGYGFVPLSEFTDEHEKAFEVSLEELARYYRNLLRRLQVVMVRLQEAGIDTSQGVAVEGVSHLRRPDLLAESELKWLETASVRALRRRYEEVTSSKLITRARREHPVSMFVPPTTRGLRYHSLGNLV